MILARTKFLEFPSKYNKVCIFAKMEKGNVVSTLLASFKSLNSLNLPDVSNTFPLL
jgi:hypothetical protein